MYIALLQEEESVHEATHGRRLLHHLHLPLYRISLGKSRSRSTRIRDAPWRMNGLRQSDLSWNFFSWWTGTCIYGGGLTERWSVKRTLKDMYICIDIHEYVFKFWISVISVLKCLISKRHCAKQVNTSIFLIEHFCFLLFAVCSRHCFDLLSYKVLPLTHFYIYSDDHWSITATAPYEWVPRSERVDQNARKQLKYRKNLLNQEKNTMNEIII